MTKAEVFRLWQRANINSKENGTTLPLRSRQFPLFLIKLCRLPYLAHPPRISGNACWTFYRVGSLSDTSLIFVPALSRLEEARA